MIDPKKIWRSSQLPTLPSVAVTLLELSKNPNADLRDVVKAIKADPALTAKILKAANSSFFATRAQVTSIDRAVALLGTTVVTSLALSFSLVEATMTTGPMAEHYNRYWMQSVVQAMAAELLCEFESPSLGGEYFLAGLLIDLGRLAMLKTVPQEYRPVLDALPHDHRPLHEIEREMLGIDHVEIGAQLMENYRLPVPLIEAERIHHASVDELMELAARPEARLCKAVAVATAVGEYFCLPNKATALRRLQALAGGLYGQNGRDLDALLARVKERVESSGDLFAIDSTELGDPSDLMAAANEQLAQLAVREHVATTQALARNEAVEREKQELETRARHLEQEAMHDSLTGLYNRRYFNDALDREVQRCCRTAEPIAVLFADIDRFKQLNDQHGHAFGDQVLKRTGEVLAEALRKSDVLARFGGEEFVILAMQPTEKGLEKVAERIRAHVEREPHRLDGRPVSVTISIGAALAIPGCNEPDLAARLLESADEAMYDSKRNGRNQVHLRLLCSEEERRLAQLVVQHRFSRWLVQRELIDIPAATRALLQCQRMKAQIGRLAQQQHWLGDADIELILLQQQQTGARFGLTAIQLGLLSERQVALLLALQQEDPVSLAGVLVRMGLLEPQRIAELVEAYFADNQSSRSRAALVGGAACDRGAP